MDGNFALYYPINTSKNDNNSTTNKQCAINEFRNIKKYIINKLLSFHLVFELHIILHSDALTLS